jgi:hypothetical protein
VYGCWQVAKKRLHLDLCVKYDYDYAYDVVVILDRYARSCRLQKVFRSYEERRKRSLELLRGKRERYSIRLQRYVRGFLRDTASPLQSARYRRSNRGDEDNK